MELRGIKKLRWRVWYCKEFKKTGKPIMLQDLETMQVKNIKRIAFQNVHVEMSFNNSKGKSKSSGATTVLEVYE